jgi:hypothetical protein
MTSKLDGAFVDIDPTGKVASIWVDAEPDQRLLLEMPSRTILDRDPSIFHMGPGGRRWLSATEGTPERPQELILRERGRKGPLVRFLSDEIGLHRFSADGRYACGGSIDGAVHVVDFVELQRRLAGVGLGW